MSTKAAKAIEYIEKKRADIIAVSDAVWRFAEVGLQEYQSSKCLAEALEKEGFTVELGVAGLPTAFVATWGRGKPVVGFLGEYDALPGLSQKAVPFREELEKGKAGHGCGHNLLGAGAFGAVVGLKQEMLEQGISGTLKYFGCPAEENFSGKAFMAREGLFSDCDVCLTWHPGSLNRVSTGSSLANNAVNVIFRGQSAHAAGDPYNGRSALDALQLMNLGVEFLREHMPPESRVHYVITQGGGQPNVVPAYAKAWYLVRAPRREEVDDLYERVIRCAEGAALMTDTEHEIQLIKAIWNVLPNPSLELLLQDCMERVGPPKFGPNEESFAKQISASIPEAQRRKALEKSGIAEEMWDTLLNNSILPRPESPQDSGGSTDVGDVSWCCPTAQFNTACNVVGTPGHSWQYVSQAGMGIGHEGMLMAAKVLAEAGFELLSDEKILSDAKKCFTEVSKGQVYKCAMPEDHQPVFDQFGPTNMD
ncbi:MAG: amidohydrolase [Firmicutes bacterium]|jgi:aminobenzoyl-glutamate utilization protein B|nr:amidohydrolase [Candidatus Fermentithermobacillaceae bacterium]